VVAGLLIEFSRVQWKAARRFRTAEPASLTHLDIDAARLARRLRLRRPIAIATSDVVGSPVVWGLWRPQLILPKGLAGHLSRNQLEWVLLHELAHVRRGDLWLALIQRLAQIAYFFHPAVWLANWQIDRQRELACDDVALGAASASSRECASGLVSVAEWACGASPGLALGLLHSQSDSLLRKRVMRLVAPKQASSRLFSISSWAILAIVSVLVLPHVRAQQAPSTNGDRRDDGQAAQKAEAPADQDFANSITHGDQNGKSDENETDSPEPVKLPPLEQRVVALKVINADRIRAWPDLGKLRVSGERRDLYNPKYPYVTADLTQVKEF
jgi:beta-lactamase regulating signal transducer with metallopeptidase domain